MDSAKLKIVEQNIADAASKNVAALLHQPKELEQILRARQDQINSEKSTIDIMMKTMLESHLHGVKMSIENMDHILKDVNQLRTHFQGILDDLEAVKRFRGQFQTIREEHSRHSQLAAAVENAKQVFSVAEITEKSKKLIEEGKLLLAHQSICDLERARDDLMFEFFKQPTTSQLDQVTLEKYFQPVDSLSVLLSKQIFVNMKRAINIFRKEPALIVSCLRIIEREERIDSRALERKTLSGFCPASRPKGWRAKCFQALEESVKEKIEGSNITDAKAEKTWLVKHLEIIRQIVLNDLSVIRGAAVPCFPPSYDILNAYANMYHRCIAKQISDLILHEHLEAEDIVTLLAWLEEYAGTNCLGNPLVQINTENLGSPLLEPNKISELMSKYQQATSQNIDNWLLRALNVEKSGWFTDHKPDDSNTYLQTQTPTDVFQIFDQNINIAAKMGEDMEKCMYGTCLSKLADFSDILRNAFTEYKTEKFKNRQKLMNFTAVMMAVINDCNRYIEYVQLWAQQKTGLGHKDRVVECYQCFERVRRDAIFYLLEEPMHDIAPNLKELFSSHWLKAPTCEAMGVVTATLKDYSGDYRVSLMPDNYVETMENAQLKVLKAYLHAILDRHLKFKNMEERLDAVNRIKADMVMLFQLNADLPMISRPSEDTENVKHIDKLDLKLSYEIFDGFCDMLLCSDDMIQLELSTFVKKFTDCTAGQVARMMDVRGDMKLDLGDLSKGDGAKVLDVMTGETMKKRAATIFLESPYRQ